MAFRPSCSLPSHVEVQKGENEKECETDFDVFLILEVVAQYVKTMPSFEATLSYPSASLCQVRTRKNNLFSAALSINHLSPDVNRSLCHAGFETGHAISYAASVGE
jgi:hypothetical protein